ncbi:MAG TPA: lipid-A-disaccharide synthase [Lichenihabitans sp.]|jgi:lipid-A-disaccharide synthase|nr:lipid-A-disaccharide synthase [Lichenihabitans sp.]
MSEAASGGRSASPRIFIVAGEHSGDHLGAGLMRALRDRLPDVAFEGVGGNEMSRAGLRPLFPMREIAIMGFVPVIRALPRILRRIADTAEAAVRSRPDVMIIIDSPDFTHRVARRVRRRAPAIPIVDYVSPTVWAWRPGRAAAMRAYVDHLLALLPFEPAAHRRLGGPPCTYVGHPLIERLAELRPNPEEAEARRRPSLLVLPGSRGSEIRRLSAVFGETIGRVVDEIGPVDLVLPAVADHEAEIRERTGGWRVAPRIVTGEAAKLAAFRRARAALAASGTVTLELALSGVPMVVAYKISPFETWLKYVVTVRSMVLPNLILGRNAVPEFFQEGCEPRALADALRPLLQDGPQRQAQLAGFAEVDRLMRIGDGCPPSRRAADIVLSVIRASR